MGDIGVRDGRLSIRHQPLPWFGARELEAGSRARLEVATTTDSEGDVTSRLIATARDGSRRKLLSSDRQDEMAFLASRLSAELELPAPALG